MSVPEPRADADLVSRIRAGDEAAFEALFRSYYTPLADYIYTLVRSRAAAEDVVQEVLIAAWTHRDRLDPAESIRAYLYRAARNRALNVLRHRRVEDAWRRRAESAPATEAGTPDGDAPLLDAELAAAIRDAVAALPERCREVFLLSRDEGLTYAEIARVLQISVKTVETQMGRALKALRSRLDAYRA